MAKKTVLYLCHNHPYVRPGGAETYAFETHLAMKDHARFTPVFLAKGGVPISAASQPHPGTSLSPAFGDPSQYFLWTHGSAYDFLNGTSRTKDIIIGCYRDFLQTIRPDVVHFQHTLFFGYDFLRETRNTLPAAPIVYTLHEFNPICHREGQMLRTINNNERCLQATPQRCHECFDDVSPQAFFMRKMFIQSQMSLADVFLAPSRFLLERFVDWGIPREKIVFEDYGRQPVTRFAPRDPDPTPTRPRNRFAYFGQFNPYKGVDVLMKAMALMADEDRSVRQSTDEAGEFKPLASDPHVDLHGANLDMQSPAFRDEFSKLVSAARGYVTLVGKYAPHEQAALMADVDWVVVPSIWWENSPLVIQEAFMHGKPVICSDIGGMAEKVTDGVDGLHFKASDPSSLARVIRRASTEPGLWERLRSGIRPILPMADHITNLTSLYDRADRRESDAMTTESSDALLLVSDVTLTTTPPEVIDPPQEKLGYVDVIAWLDDDLLLLAGWFDTDESAALKLTLFPTDGRAAVEALAHVLTFPRGDTPTRNGWIVLARFPEPLARDGKFTGGMVLSGESVKISATADRLKQAAVGDVFELCRNVLGGLSPELRDDVLTEALALLTAGLGPATPCGNRSLAIMRAALRTKLPVVRTSDTPGAGMCIDLLAAVDDRAFYVRGWMFDLESPPTHMTAVSPEGIEVELLDRIFWHRRVDVERGFNLGCGDSGGARCGFVSYFQTPVACPLLAGWTIRVRNRAGSVWESPAPLIVRDPTTVRELLLADVVLERLPGDELRRTHLQPAFSRIQEARRRDVRIEFVQRYGPVPLDPPVSVIVPLYKRIDFLEHQLAQFVHDPQFQSLDLIYVLDSPELAHALLEQAPRLYALYRVPFRVVTLAANSGYSAANNIGASLALAERLLLLNSDVLPTRPGWVSTLADFFDVTPDVGAVGVKLLYEDDSLQHAGMYFTPTGTDGEWDNMHYYKGMHRTLPAADVVRQVPAVTGACVMIRTEVYHSIGGLRGIFIQGDYEDSDLCLRLLELGKSVWYFPRVELYHLEGQSYPTPLRLMTTVYNRWLQTRLWDAQIRAMASAKLPAL